MSNPFLGQIQLVGFTFAPAGWALCQGQVLAISQNTALFSLLGTMYGGNGTTTFALPNLQGAVPINAGAGAGLTSRVQGQTGGETAVTLTVAEIPAHTHALNAVATAATQTTPGGNVLGAVEQTSGRTKTVGNVYTTAAPSTALAPQAIGLSGQSQPHNNLQPYLTMNYCIALQGVFPARS